MNKTLLLALAGTLLIGATVFLATHKTHVQESAFEDKLVREWKKFKHTFAKKFTNVEHDLYRMEIFSSNLKKIAEDKTGTLGITPFADMSQEEFAEIYLTLRPVVKATDDTCDSEGSADVNWVTAGKVTAVKNQGSCGSCWAFSTTGALESALILAGAEQTIDLSEQQLVDCSFANYGCNGGWMDYAFEYIIKNGITTETNYPYKATRGICKFPTKNLSKQASYSDVTTGCVTNLKNAVAQQPVAIAVDATEWSLYKTGVVSTCGTTLNHGVLLVGFQDDAWLVKNSWGTSWGQSGYIQLADGNTCGLANAASWATV